MNEFGDLLSLKKFNSNEFTLPTSSELYKILWMDGRGKITVDLVEYPFNGKVLLFTSPYQHLSIKGNPDFEIEQLAFHGDFYCIEYHKKEVACNGLLFNNIYKQPYIQLKDNELYGVFEKIRQELKKDEPYAEPILKSYLQLVLAISSKIKRLDQKVSPEVHADMDIFRTLLEEHYLTERTPLFYAGRLSQSPGSFAKKCRKHFGKSPSRLIQERVILEAKKQLHLTHKSIKEIAANMNFDDEHYFSRFFKKHTGISPSHFREKTGISIVANLSMR